MATAWLQNTSDTPKPSREQHRGPKRLTTLLPGYFTAAVTGAALGEPRAVGVNIVVCVQERALE